MKVPHVVFDLDSTYKKKYHRVNCSLFLILEAFKMFCVETHFAMENENSILIWINNW